MAKGYSSDLRIRIHGAIKDGVSCRAAARQFGVSASTGVRLAQRVMATGSIEPGQQGRPPGGGKLAPYADLLLGWVATHVDITMPELAARLEAEKGVTVHPASLSRFLIVRGLSFKKKHFRPAKPAALMSRKIAEPG